MAAIDCNEVINVKFKVRNHTIPSNVWRNSSMSPVPNWNMYLLMMKFYHLLTSKDAQNSTAAVHVTKKRKLIKLRQVRLFTTLYPDHQAKCHWCALIAPSQTTWQCGTCYASSVFLWKVHEFQNATVRLSKWKCNNDQVQNVPGTHAPTS